MTTTDTPRDASIPVHIIAVIDESASMTSRRSALIESFNEFLAEQKAAPGKCRLTLVKFTTEHTNALQYPPGVRGFRQPPRYDYSGTGERMRYTVVHRATPIDRVRPLTWIDYAPSMNTPLYDAEGRALTEGMARELDRARAGKKAEAVLFVTFTDGQENKSREWTAQSLAAAKAEREAAGWTCLYLGVGHDAYAQAADVGVYACNTVSLAGSDAGIHTAWSTVSAVATGYRDAAFRGDRETLTRSRSNAYAATGVAKPEDDPSTVASSSATV